MKKEKFLILLFFILSIVLKLNGGYWSKDINFNSEQVLFERKSGHLLAFGYGYTIFDLSGMVDTRGYFRDNNTFQLTRTIKLDDGSFFSIGFGQNGGKYGLLRFNRDGNVLFSKEFNMDKKNFYLINLLQLEDKIKIIGRYDEDTSRYVVIFTLSMDGMLLNAKVFNGGGIFRGSYYCLDADACTDCVNIDSNHYGIISPGYFYKVNEYKHYHGILVLKMNSNDDVIISKWYYTDHLDLLYYYYDTIIKKDTDEGYSILAQGYHSVETNYQSRFYFLKLDKNWDFIWSKRFTPECEYDSMSTDDFFQDTTGYIIGINKYYEISDQPYWRPLIFKINNNGSLLWCKTFNFEESNTQDIDGMTALRNGDFILLSDGGHGSYVNILDQNGEVSGGCNIYEDVAMIEDNMKFDEENWGSNSIVPSNLSVSVEDTNVNFYGTSSNGIAATLCEYLTIEGQVSYFEERSMFAGYYILKLKFYVDPMILNNIATFKIYSKYLDEDYILLSEIVKEEGKKDYELEIKPFFSDFYRYRYKVVAVNSEDEVVDMAIPVVQD
jgi:hypothetical protein